MKLLGVDMRRFIISFLTVIYSIMLVSAVDNYNTAQARQYTYGAEYYQKRADCYRREAQYYLKKAECYQREAAYYTRKGDLDKAKDYTQRAHSAMDDHKAQMRYAANADDKAADYLKKAEKIFQK